MRRAFLVAIGAWVLLCLSLTGSAQAQVVSCSKFLHNRDGSWSSFVTGDVLGSRGVVHIHAGERLSVRGPAPLADLAHILDGMCQSY